jgi:hypothetical protein
MIQTCAMVDEATGRVANLIVADPEHDNAWPGHILVAVDEGQIITVQWGWSEDKGFFPADPSLIEELHQHDEEEKRAAMLRSYLLDE